jgi:PAS domain S-box-containing protein
MEAEGREQKSVILILARELAANVATPILITDSRGKMVFYNEAAEQLLGQSFHKTGEVAADNWRAAISPQELDGSEARYDELPLVVALTKRQPSHKSFVITGYDGKRHRIEATSYPLIGNGDRLAGAVSIFWDAQQV